MKHSFIRVLLLGIFLSTFFACSSNVDESLRCPPVHERLGHHIEQIQYWEQDAGDYFLDREEKNILLYRYKEDSDIYVFYSFKDDIVHRVIFGKATRTKEESLATTNQFFEVLDKYGFTINLGKRDSEHKLGQLLRNKYDANLYCKLVSDFTDWETKGLVVSMMLFYKE